MSPNLSQYFDTRIQTGLGTRIGLTNLNSARYWDTWVQSAICTRIWVQTNRVTSTHESVPVQLPSDIRYLITCKKGQKCSRFADLQSHLLTKLKALSIEPSRMFWMHEWTRFIAVTVKGTEGRQFVARTRLEGTGTGKIPCQQSPRPSTAIRLRHSSINLKSILLIHCIRNITTHTGWRWILNQ